VNIAVEFDEGGYDPERAEARVRGIGDTLRKVFDDAARMQATPLTAAMELARHNLAAAGGTMPATGTDPEPAGRL
jgi:leucine dehydrogenase